MAILTDNEEVRFEDLFKNDKRRIVLVVTFMAILELVKMQEIAFRQENNFGEIFVSRKKQNNSEVSDSQQVNSL